MMIDLNFVGTIASIVSLGLAVIFWWLANNQASKADSTLSEIKDKMMSWQNDINSAAINLIQARPEVIALQVSLEEAKGNAAFQAKISEIIQSLSRDTDESTAGYRIAMMKELLEHHRQSVLGSEQIKANIITGQKPTAS
ncbi:MAG: hypothetical protein ABI410_22690 [Rhodoferax sp.]|uniref:hypothetical protein n=1 Tax=Rhodoferax sp. TaxID=50421 RepID=UPI003263CAB9